MWTVRFMDENGNFMANRDDIRCNRETAMVIYDMATDTNKYAWYDEISKYVEIWA